MRARESLPFWMTLFLAVVGLLSWWEAAFGGLPPWGVAALDWTSRFAAVFLGIFIEAAPFLLLGTLASGIVEVFLDRAMLASLLPRSVLGGALAGSLFGLFFPVCECGVVPFARRLMRKGVPAPVTMSTLLAAPVINPIVIASTWAAFGWGPVLWGRLAGTLVIAVVVGVVFGMQPRPGEMMREDALSQDGQSHHLAGAVRFSNPVQNTRLQQSPLGERVRRALLVAVDEFFEMGHFLVLGAIAAALMQTLVRQPDLLAVGQGPVLSVAAMVALAVLLSICSTVDAFIALAFVGTFTTGSILAFLVYGPMVDIKSTLMFLRVFRPRTVVYLVLLPLLLTVLMAVTINYL